MRKKKLFEDDEVNFFYEIGNKIMESISTDDNIDMLNQTDLLMKSLTNEFKKRNNLNKIETEIRTILKDTDKMRILRILQRVKKESELAIEYYHKDVGNDERLFYNEETEKQMFELQEKIRTALSKVIKEMQSEDDY